MAFFCVVSKMLFFRADNVACCELLEFLLKSWDLLVVLYKSEFLVFERSFVSMQYNKCCNMHSIKIKTESCGR